MRANSLMVTGQRRNLFVFCRAVLLFLILEVKMSILCDFGASKILCRNCCLFLVGSYVEGGKVYGPDI